MNTKFYKITSPAQQRGEIEEIAALLKSGEVVAIPTETVYGLAANALDPAAVKKIFAAKGRPQDNPLIVHIAEVGALYSVAAEVPDAALRLAARFWPGPLTMILPKKDCVPDEVSAGLSTVAVRMPSHPAANAIIKAAGVPLAAPSANLSGFPSPTCAEHVADDMNGRVAAIADGGPCDFGIESTVVTLATDPPRLLRPGAVTHRQLEEVLGTVEIDPAVLHPLESGAAAASPGMKYRHYAPNAKIAVIKGGLKSFLSYVYRHENEADYCLCFEGEEKLLPLPAVTYGREDDAFTQTRRLFDALRELDEAGAKRVFARAPEPVDVGLGVCNRLYRAAGFTFLEDNPAGGNILGLCGLSGAGKSTVCDLLRDHGAVIIDTDKIAREIVEPGSPVLAALAAAFGADILLPDGSLDRKILALRAFSAENGARRLSAITHPAIIRIALSRAFTAKAAGKTAVIDAPLLFSSGLSRACDLTCAVTAPEEIRFERIKARDGIPDEEIKKRFSSQREEAQAAKAADLELRNYPPYDLTEETERLWKTLFRV